jgi:hypothetical protein
MSTTTIGSVCRRSRLMALFYAAECGLKFLYMDDSGVQTTSELRPKIKEQLGSNKIELHDLELLCEINAVAPADTGTPPQFTSGGEDHRLYRIHEAARYGVKLPNAYLSQVEDWLLKVNAEVGKRMKDKGAYNGC